MTSSTVQHQKNRQPLAYFHIIRCFSALNALLFVLFSDKIQDVLLFLAIYTFYILIFYECIVPFLLCSGVVDCNIFSENKG